MDVDHEGKGGSRSTAGLGASIRAVTRLVGRIIYWLAVVVISVVILVLLVRWFESHDLSSVGGTLVASIV